MKTKEPKAAKPKRPAQSVHRRLRAKLEALVARPGTVDEGTAAAKKLERLLNKYEFLGIEMEGVFAGKFEPSATAYPVADFEDLTIATWVKWAIEGSTPIRCAFAGSVLIAEATPRTTEKLTGIAETIRAGMVELWAKFGEFPGVYSSDRGLFLRGLFDGMTSQHKPEGEQLPVRTLPKATRKAKARAVGFAQGLNLHPYSVAWDLGKQIRFQVPLVEISAQLENLKPREITQ